jgi:hypothetical protein
MWLFIHQISCRFDFAAVYFPYKRRRRMMTIVFEPYLIPEKGKVQLKIDRSFEIKVTAAEARRQVRWWLRDEVSMLIDAGLPTLIVGEQVVWRVPAVFSAPGAGRVGEVGVVDVDVTTGAMNATPAHKAAIARQAEKLAVGLPPYQPKGPVSPQYRPRHIPPAPKIILDNQGLPVVRPTHASKTDPSL